MSCAQIQRFAIRWARATAVAAAMFALSFGGSAIQAADINWNVVGPADWNNAANWDAGLPGASDTAHVENGGTANITTAVGPVGNTHVSPSVGGNTVVNIGADANLGDTFDIGKNNGSGGFQAIINHSAGVVTANHIRIADNNVGDPSSATYNLTGGQLVSRFESWIGDGDGSAPVATFNQTGGTFTLGAGLTGDAQGLILGGASGSKGVYNMSAGRFEEIATGARPGDGPGAWNYIGRDGGSEGEVNLSGTGVMSFSGRVHVGGSGTGTVNQTGGLLEVRNHEIVIGDGGGTGHYNISAGDIRVARGIVVGHWENANADMTISGTANILANEFVVANRGTGVATINGGTLNATTAIRVANQLNGIGTYVQNGGVVTTAAFIMGEAADGGGGTGTATINGGTLNATQIRVGGTSQVELILNTSINNPNGAIISNNGTLTIDGSTAAGAISTGGSLTVNGAAGATPLGLARIINNGTLNVTSAAANGGVIDVRGTLNAPAISVSSGGVLTGNGIANGAVTVNGASSIVPGTGATPVGALGIGDLTLKLGAIAQLTFGPVPGNLGSSSLVQSGGNVDFTAGPVIINLADNGYVAGTYSAIKYTGTRAGTADNLFVFGPNPAFAYTPIDNVAGKSLDVLIGPAPASSEWQVGSGNWGTASNWTGPIPSGLGAIAKFAALGSPPATVTLDTARTVGTVILDNGSAYTIGGANALTLDTTGGGSQISVIQGSHIISAPVVINKNVLVSGAGNLSLNGGVTTAAGKSLVKTGGGSLTFGGNATINNTLAVVGGNVNQAASTTVSANTLSFGAGAVYNNEGSLVIGAEIAGGPNGSINLNNAATLSFTDPNAKATFANLNAGNATILATPVTVNNNVDIATFGPDGLSLGSNGGSASYVQSGASKASYGGTLHLGVGAGSTGDITINSGDFRFNKNSQGLGLDVGSRGGSGKITVNGGTFTQDTNPEWSGAGGWNRVGGEGDGSRGELIINGGNLTFTSRMQLGRFNDAGFAAATPGVGIFTMTGGTYTQQANGFYLADDNAHGRFDMSGGTFNVLNAGEFNVGHWDHSDGQADIHGTSVLNLGHVKTGVGHNGGNEVHGVTVLRDNVTVTMANSFHVGASLDGGISNTTDGTLTITDNAKVTQTGDNGNGNWGQVGDAGATGVLNIKGHGLLETSSRLTVGNNGNGTINITEDGVMHVKTIAGVSLTEPGLLIGDNDGGVGVINVSDNGRLQVDQYFAVGHWHAQNATLNVNGGTVDVGLDLGFGTAHGNNGTNKGVGNQTAGNVLVHQDMSFATVAGSDADTGGTYNLTGGTLAVDGRIFAGTGAGGAAFNFNGGTLKVGTFETANFAGNQLRQETTGANPTLLLADDRSTVINGDYSVKAGEARAGAGRSITVNGVTKIDTVAAVGGDGLFNAAGGMNITGTLTKTGNGELRISGPQNHTPGAQLITGSGATNINSNPGPGGPTLSIIGSAAAAVNFNAVGQSSVSSINLTGGGKASIGQSAVHPPYAPGNKYVQTKSLSVDAAGGSSLDVNDNVLIVDYTGGASPAGAIASLLTQGFNVAGTIWDGPGIKSSSARDDAAGLSSLGMIDNADIGYDHISGNQFNFGGPGDAIPAQSVLVKYTYGGDTDLNGVVDGDDLVSFNVGYLNNLSGWANGDFDYSGVVDGDDLTVLLVSYNQTHGGPYTGQVLSDGGVRAVPEPGTLALVALGALGVALAARRRSK